MPTNTDLNISPFFDDFDRNKKFQRILFRPRAVQARELNQLQTILQDQIDGFGRHMFEEGAIVVPGGHSFNSRQDSIEISFSGGSRIQDITGVEGLRLRSKVDGLEASVLWVIPADGAKRPHIFLNYEGNVDTNRTRFDANEPLVAYTVGAESDVLLANVDCVKPVYGQWFSIREGIYFIRGFFLRASSQRVLVSRNTTTANRKVGFNVVESIVDETQDNSLYSNANGFNNFKAPGASRLKIELLLSARELTDVDQNFVPITTVKDGEIQTKQDNTVYATMGRTLAQRTYEESGNYTVTPFPLETLEHLKTEGNNGLYTAAEGGLESNFVARLRAGVGYVLGYRVENIGAVNLVVQKARKTNVYNNASSVVDFGSYLVASSMTSAPILGGTVTYRLETSAGVEVGSCRVRSVRKETSGKCRIYVADVAFQTGKTWGDVHKIAYSSSTTAFSAVLESSALYDGSKSAMVFRLGRTGVASLRTDGSSDTNYRVMRSFELETNASGVAAVNLNSNESFEPVNDVDYFLAESGVSSGGAQLPLSSISLGGSPVGRTLTVNLGVSGANKKIRLVASLFKTAAEKSKTITNTSVTKTFVDMKTALSHADVIEITSATGINSGRDYMPHLILDGGQRPGWYQNGTVSLNIQPDENVALTYAYFQHGVGDYFSVDSYGSLTRDEMGKVELEGQMVSLADCLDFRPLRTGGSGDTPRTNDNVRSDIVAYLPRVDAIYVNSDGAFGVATGVSSETPHAPAVPEGTMRLYNMTIPAYTNDASDVRFEMIDNRRYTMRDIGALERRISNVEYYTTLNMLEMKAKDATVIDPLTGNDRFKNGFAVDGFTDLKLANVGSSEFHAALDVDNGVLAPEQVTNALMLEPTSGTHLQTGDLITVAGTAAVIVDQPYATRTININPYAVFTWTGNVTMSPASDFWKDVVYLAPQYVNVTVDNTNGVLPGTSVFQSVSGWWVTTTTQTRTLNVQDTQSVADNFVSSQVIPWMRAIAIRWTVKGMRPFTRVYPFWDGVAVSAFCTQDGKAKGEAIETDRHGEATGVFQVPNDANNRFRTGVSEMRFTDSPTDSRNANDNLTAASAAFSSGGTLETRQVMVVNTRTLSISTRSTSRTVNTDPIAQTFFTDKRGGSFLDGVDIYFSTKAKDVPVRLQLRTVENGMPTNHIMPFGEIVLKPEDVVTSEDGTAATYFKFESPIYIEQAKEYAVVLLADTQEYNVYLAQMGENVIGQRLAIAKQPHLGVFFTSSNGSTWTANQIQDMKFRVKALQFDTAAPASVVFESLKPDQTHPVENNGVRVTSGSSTATFMIHSHGFLAGDVFNASGLTGGAGITDEMLNKTHTVVTATMDSLTVDLGAQATSTAAIGGLEGQVTVNAVFSALRIVMATQVFEGTTITWEARFRQQTGRSFTDWAPVDVNSRLLTSFEGVARQAGDFQLRATMSTSNANLSPVIDMITCGVETMGFRVNNDVNAPAFSYVSREVNFDNPSTSARMYVAALLPGSSDLVAYAKLKTTADQDLSTVTWTQLSPTSPLVNSDKTTEYTYQIDSETGFVGLSVKFAMLSPDTVNPPMLDDIRIIALA